MRTIAKHVVILFTMDMFKQSAYIISAYAV